jgi:hypothetical protein
MSRFENTEDLIEGILHGQVPHQVRLFAAQGLLPIPMEDLMRLQAVLSTDPDQELAELAKASISAVDEDAVKNWISSYDLDPLVLDLIVRLREEESIRVAVASHARVSDETLRVLSRNGSTTVQDIIITNQVRIFSCLEILDDLRGNPRVSDTVLRRVREFEEEFLEKAIASEGGLAQEETPTIESALEALQSIGAHIPHVERLPYQESTDPGVEEAVGTQGSAFGRLLKMNVREKVMCGLKGSREERAILINSRNRLVVRGVLASPKLSDAEIEKFAGSRTVDSEVLRIIHRNPRWMRRYQVVYQLVANPKTPVNIGMSLVNRLNVRDLKRLVRNRNINHVVRRAADTMAKKRR